MPRLHERNRGRARRFKVQKQSGMSHAMVALAENLKSSSPEPFVPVAPMATELAPLPGARPQPASRTQPKKPASSNNAVPAASAPAVIAGPITRLQLSLASADLSSLNNALLQPSPCPMTSCRL